MEAPAPTESGVAGGAGESAPEARPNAEARGLTLPNLIVIGAQKCGTSGLHYYLSLHPEVSMSDPKELNFFIAERNFPRGLDWYSRHFDPSARCRGEASPNYTAYPQHLGVPERMAEVVPEARLVYIVRDPIDRITAHWVHNYAKRREKGDLAKTLLHPNTSYVSRSRYFMQLQRFLEHFPREQILVLDNRDLRDERMPTLRRVFEFAGVDASFEHPKFEQVRHSTSKKKRATRLGMRVQRASRSRMGRRVPRRAWLAMDVALPLSKPIDKPAVADVKAALGEEVLEVLHEDAEKLRALTGRDFAHWSV
ncbi:MAG: sulfotransferase [Solirubrobacterales bacterium]|nr:sulfotransferase [Solirubrobacterales bacterium]MCB8970872.1 sulfotransferase [Thermoleophilales bacterium]MCO5326233.1 sulfotransferase domain-containing protein [Solirubrobacterales bacterium]